MVKNKRKVYRFMWILFVSVCAVALAVVLFLNQPRFGRLPRGERLERVLNSPNYRDGSFRNRNETPQLTSDESAASQMLGFIFRKVERLRPDVDIPAVKTDLRALDPQKDIYIWLGHGSYLLQTGGNRFLVDPVLDVAAPVSFYNKAFPGTVIYTLDDIPPVDYLVITHDHWDHLDHRTVRAIRRRTGKVICPLGVGEHFERWGYEAGQLIEMDWYDSEGLGDGFAVDCLPARHFSGRGLRPNQSLWASFMIRTPSGNIFLGGDGGYDTHFAEIARRYGPIDIAILENGQYDLGWKYIHLLPGDLVQAIKDLSPRSVFTVHNSKYALSKHAWDEPMAKISEAAEKEGINLVTPMIGEVVELRDSTFTGTRWWEGVGK